MRSGISALLLALSGPLLAADLSTRDTPAGSLALPVVPDSLVVSPDSARVAFAAKAGDVTLEDKGIFLRPGVVNPANDGARTLVNPISLYIDGKPTIPFDSMSAAIFSPDSKRLGFAGRQGKKWQLVLDNKTLTQDADDAPAVPIVFSADSSQAAWIIQKEGRYLVTAGSAAWPPIDGGGIGSVSFSPDARHLGAAVLARAAWSVYLDGAPLPLPPAAGTRGGATPRLERFGQLFWSPDSAQVAYYAAFTGSTWQVFLQGIDGRIQFSSKPFDGIMRNTPVFSPDGRQWAFGASTRGKWEIVSSGDATASGAPFDQILADSLAYVDVAAEGAPPRFSLICIAQQNKKWRLVTDGKPGEEAFDAITQGSFMVSADRRHHAFAGIQNGQAVVVKDGAALARHDEVGGGTFAFSPDSQHLAYAARNGANWHACVDGAAGASFVALAGSAPAFSPDSKRVAFAAMAPDRTWRLYVGSDGELRSKPYDGFLKGSHVTWRADGTVVTLGIVKKVATRIEAQP
jgi:hypothetical protein